MTYPTIRPALTLDFEKSKKLDPRITFTRSSTATYLDAATGLVKTAPSGVARFEKEGLLIEESRTNLVIYSEDLTQSNWVKYGVTITSNAVAAPDGNTSADKMFSTAGAALLAVQQAKTGLTNAAQYTRSVFFKAAELTSATMQIGGTTEGTILCVVDLSNGTSTNGGVVTAYQNGWYKVERTFTMSGTTNDFYLRLPDSSSTNDGVYVWGAQLEAGGFPTSYIPTSGSTVTRAADVCEATLPNVLNGSEGVFVTYATPQNPSLNNHYIVQPIDTANTGNTMTLLASANYSFSVYDNNTETVRINYLAYQTGVKTVAAHAYATDNTSYITDGVVRGTDTSCSMPSALNKLYIFANSNRPAYSLVTGHFHRLTFYPERVSDASLQELTS